MSDPTIRIEDPSTWPASAREYYIRWRRDRIGQPALEELIRERIRRSGAITFAEFMELALYHPEYGYYRTDPARMSLAGDYLTSPETHPVFGFLLARWLRDAWEEAGAPPEWTVLEAGAGTGRLADQILSSAPRFDAAFAAALRYCIVEPDPAAQAVQEARLVEHAPRVTWRTEMEAASPVEGCVVSNELLDALPVHRVVRVGRVLQELWVVEREGELAEEPRALSTPELRRYFRPYHFLPPRDRPVEVNLRAPAWITAATRCLRRGCVLTLDYGGSAEELYRRPATAGTLRAYHRHTLSADPFRHIGEQDLTADVDFTALILAGEAAGLVTRAYTTQRAFLAHLAWDAWRDQPLVPFPDTPPRPAALRELVAAENLGEIRVLMQEKVD